MRLPALIAALVVVASAGLWAGSASAQYFSGQSPLFGRTHVYEGAWCGHDQSAVDRVEEDCSFDSFEACSRAMINGNFGFCTQNPAFAGYRAPPRYKKKRRAPR
jgi:hypothetical protein